MAQTRLLTPNIVTDGRSVSPNGRDATPFIWVLLVVPTIAFAIALADSNIGFKLFMASSGVTMLVLVIGLYLRSRALRAGEIRIEASGELRFMPSRSVRVASVGVAIACFVPAAATLIVNVLGLPTQSGYTRSTITLPFALALLGVWLLIQAILSARTPAGLRVGPYGIQGVRGSKRVHLGWDDLVSASPFGKHGPKLMLLTEDRGAIIIDSHRTGSDPAIVARIIEYFKANPMQRAQLSDGAAAIRILEAIDRHKCSRSVCHTT
ncbi:MAG: hypothetical protein ACTHZ9_02635 [Leucobacter sp.]